MKTKDEVLERLNKVFQDVFDDEELSVTETTTAEDIEEWDSLTHITLIASVEAEFGMKFAMKEVLGMKNVGEMIALLTERATR